MTFIRQQYLTAHEARMLEKDFGFIVQFITYTRKGLLFNIFVN